MDHLWPVEVVDDKGSAVAGAKVALIARSALGTEVHPYPGIAATHDDKGGGKYEPKAPIVPTAGKWLLIVTLKGKAPVVQPLSLTDKKKDGFAASASPGAVATVVMTAGLVTVGASKARQTSFKVTLHPAAELVFIGGVDYDKRDPATGWLFHLYGFYRAESLWRDKKFPHVGAIVTVFAPSNITRTTRVRGTKGWIDVEVEQIHDPSARILPAAAPYQPVIGLDFHIHDFYKYLSAIGKREPGSVKEVGIFSHSYPGGPILYNTAQDGFATRPDRNPLDFDARPKDFNATNMAFYPDMPKAFTKGVTRWTVWGCSATTLYRRRSQAAMKAIKAGKPETEMLIVDVEYENHHTSVIESIEQERISEIRHRWWMDALFRDKTYPAEAAKALDIEVRSACPGVGSDPNTVEGIQMLMVEMKNHGPEYEYFRKKFGPEFAETKGKWDVGYVDYHALQKRAAVARPPFTTAYYKLSVQKVDTRWAKKGAELSFWNGKKITHPTATVKLTSKEVADLVTAGKKGHLYVLTDTADATKSQAVYVQEDEKVFKMGQDAKKDWTVKLAEL